MTADWAPGGRQPSDQTNRFGLWVRRKIGCYHPQTPSPFIIITQLLSWYSFYRPTEGGRLSRPRHCSKGAQPVPKAVYRSDYRDKHDRLRWDSNLGPLAPQSGVLPLSHHDLQTVCPDQCLAALICGNFTRLWYQYSANLVAPCWALWLQE